jgi:hypothetical protein
VPHLRTCVYPVKRDPLPAKIKGVLYTDRNLTGRGVIGSAHFHPIRRFRLPNPMPMERWHGYAIFRR